MTFDVFDDKESLLLQLKKSIEELNKNVRSLNAELNHIEQCYLVDIVVGNKIDADSDKD